MHPATLLLPVCHSLVLPPPLPLTGPPAQGPGLQALLLPLHALLQVQGVLIQVLPLQVPLPKRALPALLQQVALAAPSSVAQGPQALCT